MCNLGNCRLFLIIPISTCSLFHRVPVWIIIFHVPHFPLIGIMENLPLPHHCYDSNSSYSLQFLHSRRPYSHISRCARRTIFCFRLWRPSPINNLNVNDDRLLSSLPPHHWSTISAAVNLSVISLQIFTTSIAVLCECFRMCFIFHSLPLLHTYLTSLPLHLYGQDSTAETLFNQQNLKTVEIMVQILVN